MDKSFEALFQISLTITKRNAVDTEHAYMINILIVKNVVAIYCNWEKLCQ